MLAKFKSRLAVLAVVAFAAIGGGAALTPVAQAEPTCQASVLPTYWSGALFFEAHLGLCSSTVDKVQFGYASNDGTPQAGWFDANIISGSAYKYAESAYPANSYVQSGPSLQNSFVWITYARGAWCGGANHTVQTFFYYRIHYLFNTWTAWKQKLSSPYQILC